MKRIALFFILFIPLLLAAQNEYNAVGVPVYEGKVSFRDTVSSLIYPDKVRLKDNLFTGVNVFLKSDKDKKGMLFVNDTVSHKMIVQITDLLDVEESALYTYSIWTKYLLIIDYSQKDCYLEVRNIVFVDTGKEENTNPDRFNEKAYTAEEMFLENKYRISFVKEAPFLVARVFKEEVRNLFIDIRANIN